MKHTNYKLNVCPKFLHLVLEEINVIKIKIELNKSKTICKDENDCTNKTNQTLITINNKQMVELGQVPFELQRFTM